MEDCADVLRDILHRLTVLADHFSIAGHATNHDIASRAYAKGWSHGMREAAEYLRDALCGESSPPDEGADDENA